jgi:hypothetical protein
MIAIAQQANLTLDQRYGSARLMRQVHLAEQVVTGGEEIRVLLEPFGNGFGRE